MLSKREVMFLNESNAIERLHTLSYKSDSSEGHAKAWMQLRDKSSERDLLTLDDICHAQDLLMKEQKRAGVIVRESAHGLIRGPQNRLNVTAGNYPAPYFDDVPGLMDKYMIDLNEELNNPKMPVTDIAATYHVRFECIHPFADGNGRTGRMLANYIMKFFGLPIIVFTYADKERYYEACRSKTLMKEYFRDKFREFGICLKCDNNFIRRTEKGIETDAYYCDECNSEIGLDWENALYGIPVYVGEKGK